MDADDIAVFSLCIIVMLLLWQIKQYSYLIFHDDSVNETFGSIVVSLVDLGKLNHVCIGLYYMFVY